MGTSAIQTGNEVGGISKAALWTGRVLSAIPVLLILLGSVMKLMKVAGVAEGFARAGIPASLIVPVGLIELASIVIYAIPATAVLGAILLTGVMGGAIMTNLRISDPSSLIATLVGLLAWGGLYLRDTRLRELIPLRRSQRP